jgi:phosphate-selective porin OprO/OprP
MYETASTLRGRQPRSLRRNCTLRQSVLGSLSVLLLLALQAISSTSAHAANPTEVLGALEEPGQIERSPASGSTAASRDSDVSDPELEPGEATTILPDSEAVDTTIDDELDVPPDNEGASDDEDDALHPDEATTILPDGEAIDESIEEEAPPDETGSGGAASSSPGPPSDPEWSIRWQNAFIVERVDDPRYQFLFGGRIQNDWGVYGPDNDLQNEFGGDGTGTKFRRARIYFQGQFFRFGFFKAEYDFGDGDDGAAFSDVYAGINLPKFGLIRVGYFKEPFSLQFQNSSNFISFNERSSIDSLNPGRNSGIMVNGNFLIRDSTFALAFMRRTDDVGEGFSSKEDYHLTARVTGLPFFEDGGRRLLHLEVGFSHQFADKNKGTRYQQRPGSDFAPNVIDTGSLFVDNVELFNFGLALVEGSFSLQSEVTITLPHGGISEDPVFWGGYGELSWWVTGETRRYLRGRGVFSRVVPKSRFDPEKGQWGAFETAVRYSWLDLSDDGIRGGTLAEWSLALNWVLFSNMRISNSYVVSLVRDRVDPAIPAIPPSPGDPGTPFTPVNSRDGGIAHSWVTRIQIDF